MTDRETVNEYKRVLGEVIMPEELGSRIIERSERTMADGGASRYLRGFRRIGNCRGCRRHRSDSVIQQKIRRLTPEVI